MAGLPLPNPARRQRTRRGKGRVRHHAAVAEDAGRGPARNPRELAKGCLGEFVGELAIYAALAVLAGLLVLCVRGVDVLLRRDPIIGAAVLTAVTAGFLYGLVWTLRLRPGLYLEHLKGDPDRLARLGTEHRMARMAGMIFMQIVCLAVVGYVVTLVVWS